MASIKCYVIGLAAVMVPTGGAFAAAPVTLLESAKAGRTTRVQVELSAQGLYLPAAQPGATKTESPKPLALKVEARLDFVERVLTVDARGRAGRSVRRVMRAASALNGEIRPSTSALRADVALLVAELKADGVLVFSPSGPLTRSELELVQGPGDPLAFEGLLPANPVEVKGRWRVGEGAVKSLTSYDSVSLNKMEATLDSVDAETATVKLGGEVRGSVLGGEGTMVCEGSYTFDRKAGRIARLTLQRAETRRPGIVEEGLDVKSTLTVVRKAADALAELSDEALAKLTLDPGPGGERTRLLLTAPNGKYSLIHDRDWHTYWDDPRLIVLKRVERGRPVAQLNLAAGPNAGRGRHQDAGQFRDDVRKGLGKRFLQFLGEGEVPGDPSGGYRYKVGVQGRQGDLGVVWYYYLLAGPGGDQLLATFTMAETEHKAFGDRDEALIGSLRWLDSEKSGSAGASR